jgi:hypothetical protein
MIPSIGRIVHYTLSEDDAKWVKQHRADTSGAFVGNRPAAGDVYPMLITRTWGSTEDSAVQGQVFLDGNDTLWVTSATQGDGERHWKEPKRS